MVRGRALSQREQFEHLIFLAREMDPGAGDLDGLLIEIDDEVTGRDDGLGMALRSTNDGVNAGDELVLVERLGQIIIGAEAQVL